MGHRPTGRCSTSHLRLAKRCNQLPLTGGMYRAGAYRLCERPSWTRFSQHAFRAAELATPLARGFAGTHGLRRGYDEPRLLARPLLFLGHYVAKLHSDESHKERDAFQTGAIDNSASRRGCPAGLFALAVLQQLVGDVLKPPTDARTGLSAQQISDGALDNLDDPILLLHLVEDDRAFIGAV